MVQVPVMMRNGLKTDVAWLKRCEPTSMDEKTVCRNFTVQTRVNDSTKPRGAYQPDHAQTGIGFLGGNNVMTTEG